MTVRLVSEKSEKMRILRATGVCKTPKGRKKPSVGITQTTPPDHLSADTQCRDLPEHQGYQGGLGAHHHPSAPPGPCHHVHHQAQGHPCPPEEETERSHQLTSPSEPRILSFYLLKCPSRRLCIFQIFPGAVQVQSRQAPVSGLGHIWAF